MAYTKYSLTPANNTAAPPDGAPEGMLPSAVNDTMRDMMAQIRDCGDGIRDGTYTMTAPKITGGTITGSTINNSAIGGSTAAAGNFTTLGATGVATFSAGTVSAPAITTTGDTNTGIFFPAADTIAFTEGGTESMRIDSSGNVGIGTSSPAQKLHVAGTIRATSGGATTSAVTVTQGYINGDISSSNFSIGNYGDSSSEMRIDTRGFTTFYTGATNNATGTERMRITSGGNLCLNTTAKNNDGLLSISADSALNQGITIQETSVANNIYYIYFTNSAGSSAGRIEHTGSTTVSYVTSSDARLKTNIVDSDSAKPVIDAIKIREFDWVSGEHQKFGVVAQELIDVAPEAVSIGRKETDSWGVDYSKLVPHLIKYVQEQQALIESLTTRLNALEGN